MQRGFFFVILPIIFMVFIGMMYNNLTAGGSFQNNPVASSCTEYQCPAYSNNNPCATSSNCQLTSNSAITVLSPSSPITYLLSGNLGGFIGSFSNNQATQGIGASLMYLSECAEINSTGGLESTAGVSHIYNFACRGGTYDSTNPNLEFFGSSNYINMSSQGANMSIWTCTDCTYSFLATNGLAGDPVNVQFQAYYNNETPTATGLRLTNPSWWSNLVCGNSKLNHGILAACVWNATYTYNACNAPPYNDNETCLIQIIQSSPTSSALFNTFSFLGFIAGLLLLIIGLGLGFSGGALTFNFSVTPNSQGTRFAQIAGISLLIWIPLFSEFGGWILGSGLLWGIGVLIGFLLPAVSCFGLLDMIGTVGASEM